MKSLKICRLMILVLSALLLISACGSSSSDSPAATTTLTGSVFASSVSGASVVVKDSAGATIAGPVTTSADGSFSVAVPNSALAGTLQFQATGGTYADEMTGTTTTAGTLAAYATAGSVTATVSINPATTIIHSLISQYSKTAGEAQTLFNSSFGFTPDLSVASKNTPSTGGSKAERLAAFRAGAFSKLTQDLGLAPDRQADLIAALAQDLADGALDGKNGTTLISLGSYTVDIQNRFDQALVSYLSDTMHNLTGVLPGEIGDLAFGKVAFTTNYKLEYIPGTMAPAEGKTTFKIRVTDRASGSPVTGLSLSLMPLMYMDDRKHTSPADVVTEDTANQGTYNCTVYYLMGSGPDMGFWEIKVTVGSGMSGESAKFFPFVSMYMGMGDTPKFNLYGGTSDLRSNNMRRFYFLFNDGLTSGMTSTFNLYIAAMDSMMSMPFLTAGTLLNGPSGTTWTVNPATTSLQASLSPSFASAVTGSDCGGGHWTIPGINLSSGMTNTVYIKLTVNGEVKTAGTSTTADQFATFLLSPGMGM